MFNFVPVQDIEPYYNWRGFYRSEEDERSPFYGTEHDEFHYTNHVYNYLIHPQWDDMGSETLYLKVLFVSYEQHVAIIELIGEWNDCLGNDIMFLKRDIVDVFIRHGINRFILVGENVLNFHAGDDSYYEEWFDDVDEGWICLINFREHVLREIRKYQLDFYLLFGGELDHVPWRTMHPLQLVQNIESLFQKRLGA